MLVYLGRRVAGGVVLLAVVAAVTFVLITLAPGDTALVLAGQGGGDPEYLADLRVRLGLDRPLAYQIGAYLRELIQGDLGFSVIQGRPVRDIIAGRLAASALLAGAAFAGAAVGGVLLGVLAAARRGTRLDTAVSVLSLAAYSVPVFWLGQLLVAALAVRLHWLPAGGMESVEQELHGFAHARDVARHLLLPATTLGLLLLALVVRVTRTAMIDVLDEDYISAARGRGASELRLLFRHALPNAARPIITILTGYIGLTLTGAVLVETVFVWPGLGRLLYDAVLSRDAALLTGLLLVSCTLVVFANIVADLLYMIGDPRVRHR
jgi:peptide/nickel transport system permease protein